MKKAFLIVFFFQSVTMFAGNGSVDSSSAARVRAWLRDQPFVFTENMGQVMAADGKPAADVLFKSSFGSCDIYITTRGLSYVFSRHEKEGKNSDAISDIENRPGLRPGVREKISYYRLDMNLEGAVIGKAQIIKEQAGNQGPDNYFYPHCPEGISGVKTYGKITIKNIYDGIDWVIYANAGNRESPLKYDFVVHPQADYKDIRMKFVNAKSTHLANADTRLKIQTIAGNIEEGNLYAYQQSSNAKQEVMTRYVMNKDSLLEFEAGTYDKTKTLVIDPLVWATFYGASSNEEFSSICTDSRDNIYITGYVGSSDFPTQQLTGAYWQAANSGGTYDTFILKFNDRGVRQWATYYGGTGSEYSHCIYADNLDNIYITGDTDSPDFPVRQMAGAYYQPNNAGNYDVFVVKFNNQGLRQWATFYGGRERDFGYALAADSQDNIYLTGQTFSPDFPTQQLPGAFNQLNISGTADMFIVKFNQSGMRQWGTYYGGTGSDYSSWIAADSQDNIWITGNTSSADFPTRPLIGAYFQAAYAGGGFDAVLLKFNKQGARQWATYYGGRNLDFGMSVCADGQDNMYLTGETSSTDFPSQPMAGAYNQPNSAGLYDAFILKFSNNGERQWATYYGGSNDDYATAICSDNLDNIHVTGFTYSTDFPVQQLTNEYWQASNAGSADIFILKLNSKGSRIWATYYGGAGYDQGEGIRSDAGNAVYVVGQLIDSYDIAYTVDYGNGAYYDDNWAGGMDGFILKIEPCNIQEPSRVQSDRNNICVNDPGNIVLTAAGGSGDVLKWYSGSCGLSYVGKDSPLTIPAPARTTTYYARWESYCDTSACDSVLVRIYAVIKASQYPVICQGETVTVGTNIYATAGTYTDIFATSRGCDSIITTNLVVNPVKQTDLNPVICQGETFSAGTQNYTTAGIYRVLLKTHLGCDSTITTNLRVIPIKETTQNPAICQGEIFTVGARRYTTTGTYSDRFAASSGCDSIITTNLTVNPAPRFSLGADTLLCPGDSILLTPGLGFSRYLWSDGSVGSNLKVTNPGSYVLTVFDGLCSASNAIVIRECSSDIRVPNAFTPDNDGLNDHFNPVIPGILKSYRIIIFNRWGQQLFESDDAKAGWDGTYRKEPCPGGVYTYLIEYSTGTESAALKISKKWGLVTVLR